MIGWGLGARVVGAHRREQQRKEKTLRYLTSEARGSRKVRKIRKGG